MLLSVSGTLSRQYLIISLRIIVLYNYFSNLFCKWQVVRNHFENKLAMALWRVLDKT